MDNIKTIFGNVGELVSRLAKQKEEEDAKLPKKTAITSTKTYLHCPHCEKRTNSAVDHIGPDENMDKISSFGPWYCNHCGGSYRGQFTKDGTIELLLLEDKRIETRDLVMIPANLQHPVYMILKGARYTENEGTDAMMGKDPNDRTFFYETHSCPTNWIPNIDKMIYDGDTDPHGVIEFVRGVDVSKINDGDEEFDIHRALGSEEVLRKHFPETVVHEQFLEMITTQDKEGTKAVNAWLVDNATVAISEEYNNWLFKFTEMLINEDKTGYRWMMDHYLSKEKDGARILRVVAYPKDERKRINNDGKKVFVMAVATFIVDENDKVLAMIPESIERSGELED